MRRTTLLLLPALVTLLAFVGFNAVHAGAAPEPGKKQYQMYGVAFYNLENLFDTINNNGKYDLEFSPQGSNNWNSHKYNTKLDKLGYAISQMTTTATPMGPAIIGCSEIENESVLQDLVRNKHIRKWHLQVVHHDSPDLRGVDVGLLYNPRFFRLENVTNHTLRIPESPTSRHATRCVS